MSGWQVPGERHLQKRKKEISMVVEAQVSKQLMKDSVEDYIQFLAELREKMAQRGLTPEILENIMKDD
ncbi:MAG: hypothetical protein WD431_00300 [Cyclobacteriaceae bacterium]